MKKVVLFDLDGTLVKAGGSGRLALNKAVKQLHGMDEVCAKFFLAGGTDKHNFAQAYYHATGKKPSAKHVDAIAKRYLELLPEEVDRAVREKRYEHIKGIGKLLKLLAAQTDVMIGLGTGNLVEGASIKLAPSGLAEFFSFGGFGCDSHDRAEMLEIAVKRAEKLCGEKIPPQRVFVIGDTHKDVEAAKSRGFHSGAVTSGFGEPDAVFFAGPEMISKDFTDLASWLVWLNVKADPKGVERGYYMFPDTCIEHVQFGRTGVDLAQMKMIRVIKDKARAEIARAKKWENAKKK